MYNNNLNHKQLLRYLNELLNLGLIKIYPANPRPQYVITEVGKEWLRRFHKLEDFHNELEGRKHNGKIRN